MMLLRTSDVFPFILQLFIFTIHVLNIFVKLILNIIDF